MAPATHLSGYLKKEGKKQSLLVRTQKRFFRVEEIAPQRGDEPRLALCYYRREADAEPRGWLFLGVEACGLVLGKPLLAEAVRRPIQRAFFGLANGPLGLVVL